MVQQGQPDQLLRVLSSQLGVSPQDLEDRARQSRLGYAATMSAVQGRCNCDACRLLRAAAGKLVQDALKEAIPLAVSAPPEPVEG
jgi:hypothetical protein